MDLTAVPYLIVSRTLDFGFSQERIYICICLLDHLVLGVGLSRDESMRHMVDELEEKYGDDWGEADDDDPDAIEMDTFRKEE